MDADERDICLYLKGFPGQFVSVKEISKRAGGKRRFNKEPNWAIQILARLVAKGTVESDATGHYRLKVKSKKDRRSTWVSPQIRQILEKSGKDFAGVFELEMPESDDTPPAV